MTTKRSKKHRWLPICLACMGTAVVLMGLYGLLLSALSLKEAQCAPETLQRDFTVAVSDKSLKDSALPKVIWEKGYRYQLQGTKTRQVKQNQQQLVDYQQQEISYVAPYSCDGSISSATSLVPDTVKVDEDGYSGELKLSDVSCKEILGFYDAQVDKEVEYTGLSCNDVNQIPEYVDLTASDLAYDSSTPTLTYQRAGVVFQETQWDQWGMPIEYSAKATYRTTEGRAAVASYEITALYKGTVAHTGSIVTCTGNYQLDSLFEASTPLELMSSGLLSAEDISQGITSAITVPLMKAATDLYRHVGWQGVGAFCLLTLGLLLTALLLLISYLLWQQNLKIGGLA